MMDEAWGQLFAAEVKQFFEREAAKLRSELESRFESRFAALEEATPRVRGAYQEGEAYFKNQFVVYSGSLWCCMAGQTGSGPGTDSTWLLVVKNGQFAK